MFATQFDTEEGEFKNRKTAIAAFFTALVHALILLILIFTILHTPIPPYEDNAGGMSVNFGTDQTGAGDIQPFTYNPGPVASASSSQASSQPVESASEKTITQDESDVVVPKTEDKPKPKVNKKAIYKRNQRLNISEANNTAKASVANPVPEPKADPKALFTRGAYGRPNNSKGDGLGGPQGDQGNKNGDVNSRNYQGDGTGTGPGHGTGETKGGFSLKGRKIMYSPTPEKCNTSGKVVVNIKVDKTGKVVEVAFNHFQSTVFDECNKNSALSAARKCLFNPDPNAADIEEGTKTYIYKLE